MLLFTLCFVNKNSTLSYGEFPTFGKNICVFFSTWTSSLTGETGKQMKLLSPNRVFRVAYVKGCPDVKRPAYCPLTPLPLQAVVLFAS